MRDILKPHSGTQSGTGVSLSKMLDFDDILARGQNPNVKKRLITL
jgi:hypothetical protein